MVVLGTGVGLTSAPRPRRSLGVVPEAKAGVGSAVNDATRLLGGTLGVAVIGSVYASLYASKLASALAGALPASVTRTAHASVGAALTVAAKLAHAGPQGLRLRSTTQQTQRSSTASAPPTISRLASPLPAR